MSFCIRLSGLLFCLVGYCVGVVACINSVGAASSLVCGGICWRLMFGGLIYCYFTGCVVCW